MSFRQRRQEAGLPRKTLLQSSLEKGCAEMNDSQNREADTGLSGDVTGGGGHQPGPKWFSNKKVKWAAIVLLVWFVLAAVGPCTITHKFGPYYGKTVDAETGEPIEGAVVLVAFYTELYTPAGTMSRFVDALEVLTDAKGEFHIPAYRAWVFRAPHRWSTDARVTVFKAGYGNFPWHKKVSPKFIPMYTAPPKEYLVIKLPKLRTLDEARENSRDLPTTQVPREKMKKLFELIERQRSSGWRYFD